MLTEGACNLLHGLEAGRHGLATLFIEELAGPSGRVVLSELLKSFLQKVSAHGSQVVAEEVAEPEVLLLAE